MRKLNRFSRFVVSAGIVFSLFGATVVAPSANVSAATVAIPSSKKVLSVEQKKAKSALSAAKKDLTKKEKALKKAGLTISDIGAFEINEAFAVQVIAFLEHFGIGDDDARVNPFGGAIAVGHPLASSGVRLMINLARTFEAHPEIRYGITTMCIGLGMGGTVIWENPHFNGGNK